MSGTIQGGKLAAQKIRERDPDFFAKIGKIGGAKSRGGGFASMDKAAHRAASIKGGTISKRKRAEAAKQELPA